MWGFSCIILYYAKIGLGATLEQQLFLCRFTVSDLSLRGCEAASPLTSRLLGGIAKYALPAQHIWRQQHSLTSKVSKSSNHQNGDSTSTNRSTIANVELSLVTSNPLGNGMNATRPEKTGTIARTLLQPRT